MNSNIVITGEGIVCAVGLDKQQVLQSLQHKHTGIGVMKHLRSTHLELPVGEVPLSNDEMRNELGITDSYSNRTSLMGMLAVKQALADAGIDKQTVGKNNLRIVLVSGTTVAGMDITERFFDSLKTSNEHLACVKNHSCGRTTRMIADYFGLFDEYTTISTACSSAANALILGANMLKAGQCDMVIAGGCEALSIFHLNGFNSLMILDHEQCRPFDNNRAGLNLGEGAAFVVLEREESATKRGAEIHAYLRGYGNACDAFHQTASSENGEGAYRAMTEALQMAGLEPTDIQYVNAHGTGTPNNDMSESIALQRVFGNMMPKVSSTKSFTGHTTSASGCIETVICLLAMHHHFVPANLGFTTPMNNGIVPTMGEVDYDLRNVVCNSFGFGGNDTSLVLSLSRNDELEINNNEHLSVKELARVEITSEDELAEIRDYVKPLEARRMGKIMKSSLLSSLKALRKAGVEQPDAIITGTALGCLENSEQLLCQMTEEGEVMLKPTYFMQSTHNTIGSNIAIRLGCHGYNITYTQDEASLKWALRDAELLLRGGKCKTVLVGCHDETTPMYRELLHRMGEQEQSVIKSTSIVLTCGE
ncbi:MAG: beta-ketoacyl-[acyl-carrier-protein] synthase family protein [Bacteroidales bacterium]|nr:beta-ketoacyl-[acyl-carrier-protein] synthase family protein [Bacteroidales bacterium]